MEDYTVKDYINQKLAEYVQIWQWLATVFFPVVTSTNF